MEYQTEVKTKLEQANKIEAQIQTNLLIVNEEQELVEAGFEFINKIELLELAQGDTYLLENKFAANNLSLI